MKSMQDIVEHLPHVVSNKSRSFDVVVDRVSEVQWNKLLEQFADANFYQTWAYGAVSWGEQQLSHCVAMENGQCVGLAQLRVVRLPFLRAGVAYLRWGPCYQRVGAAADREILRRIIGALVSEYVHRRGLMLRIVPQTTTKDFEAVHWLEVLREFGFRKENRHLPYRTLRLDLTQELDVIRKRFDSKWRNRLNAAERAELTVIEGTGDELYGQFIELYDEMMARKRFDTGVNPRVFRRIQQRLPSEQKMLIMICGQGNVPQSGVVATAIGRTGIALLAATGNAGLKTSGSHLLQWRLLQRLKEHGCTWYDQGGINPQKNPGVYHFKQGMGGEEVTALGSFALSHNAVSRLAVLIGERLRKAAHSITVRHA